MFLLSCLLLFRVQNKQRGTSGKRTPPNSRQKVKNTAWVSLVCTEALDMQKIKTFSYYF